MLSYFTLSLMMMMNMGLAQIIPHQSFLLNSRPYSYLSQPYPGLITVNTNFGLHHGLTTGTFGWVLTPSNLNGFTSSAPMYGQPILSDAIVGAPVQGLPTGATNLGPSSLIPGAFISGIRYG
jgi:hypothetical protein